MAQISCLSLALALVSATDEFFSLYGNAVAGCLAAGPLLKITVEVFLPLLVSFPELLAFHLEKGSVRRWSTCVPL